MRIYGLIGFPLTHSLSPEYFRFKFAKEEITDAEYHLFPMESLDEFTPLIKSVPVAGLNVTIPYKEHILPYLDEIDATAKEVGAVNTIAVRRISRDITTKGYNTDVEAFRTSLEPMLRSDHKTALVFGTGGASRAVGHVLEQLGINYKKVSRLATNTTLLSYSDLTINDIHENKLIINTTPAGTSGNNSVFPCVSVVPLLKAAAGPGHLFYDLVYNPDITPFLQLGRDKGASIKNGIEMLHLQAEAAWKIWNT